MTVLCHLLHDRLQSCRLFMSRVTMAEDSARRLQNSGISPGKSSPAYLSPVVDLTGAELDFSPRGGRAMFTIRKPSFSGTMKLPEVCKYRIMDRNGGRVSNSKLAKAPA